MVINTADYSVLQGDTIVWVILWHISRTFTFLQAR